MLLEFKVSLLPQSNNIESNRNYVDQENGNANGHDDDNNQLTGKTETSLNLFNLRHIPTLTLFENAT